MGTPTCTSACAHIHTCAHIYTRARAHTHTHAHTHLRQSVLCTPLVLRASCERRAQRRLICRECRRQQQRRQRRCGATTFPCATALLGARTLKVWPQLQHLCATACQHIGHGGPSNGGHGATSIHHPLAPQSHHPAAPATDAAMIPSTLLGRVPGSRSSNSEHCAKPYTLRPVLVAAGQRTAVFSAP